MKIETLWYSFYYLQIFQEFDYELISDNAESIIGFGEIIDPKIVDEMYGKIISRTADKSYIKDKLKSIDELGRVALIKRYLYNSNKSKLIRR